MRFLLVIAAMTLLTVFAVWSVTMQMPLTSYAGPLPALVAREIALRADLRRHVEKLAGEIGERNLSHYEALSAAANYIEGALAASGYAVQRDGFDVATPVGTRRGYNLVVELRGTTRPEEIAVIGAHYDSAAGAPGADDNATGSAAVLVLAHALAGKPQERTVRFVLFTNEEPPYYHKASMGSLVYAKRCKARGDTIVAMMSLETIGYFSDVRGSQKYPFPVNLMYPPIGDFLGIVGNVGSRGLVRQAVRSVRQSAKLPSIGLAAPGFITGVDWSDQWSFWEQGYPGIMVTDTALFRNPYYHTRADTPDKIDYDRLARVVSVIGTVVAELATVKGEARSKENFSPDYITARSRFRQKARLAGGRLDSLELGTKGPRGEDLSIDIAWFGSKTPRRIFVHSSGLHGVEAFAGSAIQLQWLEEGIPPVSEDAAIVLVHALNPWGMAWLRRFNENNVDLNRNFLAADEKYEGAPEGYQRLDAFLNPTTPPSLDLFYLRAGWLAARYGLPALRQAVAGGQYVNPKGLFFGGQRLEAGPRMFQAYIAKRFAGAERLVAVDVHTGLGPFGEDRLLVDAVPESMPSYQALQSAFGERVQTLEATKGVAYQVRGDQGAMYYRLFPRAKVFFATQEFGTYNSVRVVAALRAENRWSQYGSRAIDHPTKLWLREVFCPADEAWRRPVLQRGREVIEQALALALEPSAAGVRP